MNKRLDTCLKKRRKAQDTEKYTALLSVLPLLSMLQKLLCRKQNGKKPFSTSFDYPSKMNRIQEIEKRIYDVSPNEELNESLKDDLLTLSEIASLAKEEIRLESLKGDFCYLSDMFAELSRFVFR